MQSSNPLFLSDSRYKLEQAWDGNRSAAAVPTEGSEPDLILLFVRNRIHCGIGRFCFAFFASTRFILKVFWDGCAHNTHHALKPKTRVAPALCHISLQSFNTM